MLTNALAGAERRRELWLCWAKRHLLLLPAPLLRNIHYTDLDSMSTTQTLIGDPAAAVKPPTPAFAGLRLGPNPADKAEVAELALPVSPVGLARQLYRQGMTISFLVSHRVHYTPLTCPQPILTRPGRHSLRGRRRSTSTRARAERPISATCSRCRARRALRSLQPSGLRSE